MNIFNKKDPFEGKTKCSECKHWVDEKDCQIIKSRDNFILLEDGHYNRYYCPEHKKPYEEIFHSIAGTTYYKRIRVDEQGVPVGYQKIKTKKT